MKKERLDALNEKDIAIGLIVSDKYCREVIPVLNPKYIEIDYIRILSSWIKEYYLEFHEAPKNNIIKLYRAKVSDLRDEALGDNILTLISNLEGKKDMNEGFMVDQTIKYLKKRSLQCLAEDIEACVSVNDIERAEETLNSHRIVEKSGSDTVSVMHSLDKVIDSFDSEEEVLLRLPGAYGSVIGDIHREDFFSFIAPFKRGKTFALMDMAVRGFFNGLKVLFVSLEMGERAVVRRFWTSISGQISKDKENINYPKFVEKNGVWKIEERRINKKASDSEDIKKMSNFIRRVARNGDIRVLAVPSYSLRVDRLETKMEKMAYEDNFIPDLVIVDYADIMCPSEKNEYRQQLDSIWKRLRSMAQKWHCAVITASQTNRDALNGDATQENVAEDIRKIAHITSMVSINQTEDEKKKGVVRFKQLAIREEGAEYRQAVCLQCLDLGKMVIDSRFDDEVEDYLYSDDGDTYRRKKRREKE
jgi:hypothetical protein